MSNEEIAKRHQAALMGNYTKMPVALVRGAGTRVWDADGKEYLDLFSGFGGSILGHCHPNLVAAITKQASQLWQVGNQFYTEPQIRLAEHLRAKAFDGQAFFCHSGAEAAEAAFKLARLAAGEDRFKIISAQKGFHGRTMGALSATPGPYQNGFAPLVPGFSHVPYNDLAALEQAIDGQTAAVILEPIQGEGGINIPSVDYLKGVRALCDRQKISLIFDEVWTGVGRTGRYFGHQNFGVTPDIMTMGKALGGGVPVGGILARPDKAALFKPGTHGCTLGGNPLCAAVAAAVFDTLAKDGLVEHAAALGRLAQHHIRNFKNAGTKLVDVRGMGLMIGIETQMADATPILRAALDKGLIINVTRGNVIRLSPALILSEADLEKGLAILEQAIDSV